VHDFGARRAPGPQSGLIAARAAYLAGCAATSHVEAAIRLGIPCSGTMAHSWVQSFADEPAALAAYANIFPTATTLLVDTYDTLAGVAHAADIEPPIQAVRLDSGDLLDLSRAARSLLDRRDRNAVRIFASGDLDEWRIDHLLAAGAPIDGFGVGTEMVTSRDAPALSLVYKLVAIDGAGRIKLSIGKKSYPLAKQVDRLRDADGRFCADRVIRWDEPPEGELLLTEVMRGGKLTAPLPDLDQIRRRCADQIAALPEWIRAFDVEPDYPVSFSAALENEARRLSRFSDPL
jgi:nicotinate phosphoribosyltransferase